MFFMLFQAGLQIPTHCRGTQNSSRTTVQTAYKELGSALENLQNMLIIALLDGVHEQASRLSQPAKEDESLGRREGCKVGARSTQHLSSEFIDMLCQSIALFCRKTHLERSNVFRLHVAQQRRLVRRFQQLARRTCHARCRAIGLQTALTASATLASVLSNHGYMAQLSGKTVAAINHLTIDNNA